MSTMTTPPEERPGWWSGRLPPAARRAAWDQLWRILLASRVSDAGQVAAQGAEDPDKGDGAHAASREVREAA